MMPSSTSVRLQISFFSTSSAEVAPFFLLQDSTQMLKYTAAEHRVGFRYVEGQIFSRTIGPKQLSRLWPFFPSSCSCLQAMLNFQINPETLTLWQSKMIVQGIYLISVTAACAFLSWPKGTSARQGGLSRGDAGPMGEVTCPRRC